MPNAHVYDAEAIIEAMRQYHEVKPLELKGPDGVVNGSLCAVPRGMELKSIKPFIDEYLLRPERRRGTAKLGELDSLIAHANRFKTRHSAGFVDGDSITVVYDYHQGNDSDDAGMLVGEPDWCQHRAVYNFPLSDEWTGWHKASEAMGQGRFAEFLEDRITDIVDPSSAGPKVVEWTTYLGLELATPTRLMSLSRNLSIRVETRAVQAVNLTTGEGQVVWEEEHKDSNYGPLKVPGAFVIAIPVFQAGALYSIPVRLRYRLQNGKISWWVSPHGTERIFKHAVSEACQRFSTETQIPLYYGAPEHL